MKLIAKAIKDGNSFVPKDIADNLREIKNYKGVTNTYNFDENGELLFKDRMGVQTIVDQKFKFIGRY